MTRAVIADDSSVMRQILTEIVESGDIEVVASVENGLEAVRAIEEHEPDVATIDLEMPKMGGLEVIERVMADNPTPMLVISAHSQQGADKTFDALEAGAVDFLAKPSGELSVDIWSKREEIVAKVRAVAESSATRTSRGQPEPTATQAVSAVDFPNDPTLIIGASTGGPRVVERVLSELPHEANFRILVVQHMADHYTGRFARRLDEKTAYDIREAADGDRVQPGEAVVAKGGYHLPVTGFRDRCPVVAHDDGPKRHNVRPAIDTTMETAAEVVTGNLVGVILTGMGADGATGISAIKRAGGKTIAQDEATSRVYGMPNVAAETGDVDMILPESRIAEGITNAFRGWST